MSSKIHKFSDSLRQGQSGEELFFELNKNLLIREDGFNYDFTFKETGERLELKSDYYDATKTENCFMERFSDVHQKTPGGAWQAAAKGVKYFGYFFVQNKELYLFETESLVKKLDEVCGKLSLVYIKNVAWTTAGYKVNRNLLTDILIQRKVY